MKVLIACEYSGKIRDAFLKKGHDAISCDLLASKSPGPHYQGNVLDIINNGFDLMIAHPPCTYLCCSGLHWNKRRPGRESETVKALEFVKKLMAANIPKICIENPIGKINTEIRKPDQYIQPHEFGHDASKKTGLWLKNLPKLKPTKHIEGRFVCCGIEIKEGVKSLICPNCNGANTIKRRYGNQTNSGQNKLAPSKDRWAKRSETYQGWADAMADQWG